MQSSQALDHLLDLLYVRGANLVNDLLLHAWRAIQELLDKLAIHKTEWRLSGADRSAEATVPIE